MDLKKNLNPPMDLKKSLNPHMEPESSTTFKSQIFSTLLPVFVATGALLQFGAPSNESLNLSLLFMATITFFLGMILLPLRFAMRSPKLNPTSARLTDHLATATLIASFSTLILALPEASWAFTNSTIFSHWSVAWACQFGLILFAIAVVYKLINEIQRCTKVVVLSLCVALAGLYTEPLFPLPSTVPYNCAIYRTYSIYQFALVPLAFVLGAILLILGVAAPNGFPGPFMSAILKKAFARLTLSVAWITLLIGASLTVMGSILNSAMVCGVGWAGDAMEG